MDLSTCPLCNKKNLPMIISGVIIIIIIAIIALSWGKNNEAPTSENTDDTNLPSEEINQSITSSTAPVNPEKDPNTLTENTEDKTAESVISTKNKESSISPVASETVKAPEATPAPTLPPDPDTEIITLKNVTNDQINGEASRKYKNNAFSFSLKTKLEDPGKDYYYEAWIIKLADFTDILSLGPLQKNEQGEYFLTFTSDKNYLRYRQVAVTIEPNDKDPDPSARLLEGNFKK